LVVEINAVLNISQYGSDLQLHCPVISSGILLSGASSLIYGQDEWEIGIPFPTTEEIFLLSTLSSGVHPNFFYPPTVENSFRPSKPSTTYLES